MKMACERLLCSFMLVAPVCRALDPVARHFITCKVEVGPRV
jgi:hypothetical protein